jgi:hypothetical protein
MGELTATTTAARTPIRPHSIMRRFQDCGAAISVESSAMLIQSLAPRRVSAFFNYDTHDRRPALRRSAGCGGRNFEQARSSVADLPATSPRVSAPVSPARTGSFYWQTALVHPMRRRATNYRAGLLEYPNLISGCSIQPCATLSADGSRRYAQRRPMLPQSRLPVMVGFKPLSSSPLPGPT